MTERLVCGGLSPKPYRLTGRDISMCERSPGHEGDHKDAKGRGFSQAALRNGRHQAVAVALAKAGLLVSAPCPFCHLVVLLDTRGARRLLRPHGSGPWSKRRTCRGSRKTVTRG